jgi:superfamily II DNA or RNA helicase
MSFAVGSLVRARGREWVVLPESEGDLLMLRPLGGTDVEVAGVYLPLEIVQPATFGLPDPDQTGDFRSARLLRDAARLGFRSSAGPFRSFARLGVEPRPYQLVPLLMALKLDPVRLLIADDVGIGKTIEAGLVARELLDRGDATRLAVLCPPHLAEQWQSELRDKFHIEAELVLPSTAKRLERVCRIGESLFDHYPHVIVSMDFIKSDKYRDDFVRTCPELVIVDEAHTCAAATDGSRGRHQRHDLLRRLSADERRHLILVTATPHSGKEDAFRSLLSLLDKKFAAMPEDLGGSDRRVWRQELAQHLVQRRRADIRHYLGSDTIFPDRKEAEEIYTLSPEYKRLFERALEYARETVRNAEGPGHHQRVRWWSALALLRSLASSPAAAAATLRARAAVADFETTEDVDAIGRRTVLDLEGDESLEGLDGVPGSDAEGDGDSGDDTLSRRRLRDMAREAEALKGDKDLKLVKAVDMIAALLNDGYNPIVFCRYIPTADYVAEELRSRLAKRKRELGEVEVVAVTGLLPPSDREGRVRELGQAPRRVLVATDCLSEGINVQEHFDAVLHYDLSWNPTRHEQRDGRVDRYGQPSREVRVVTFYGRDNQIDGIVLEVLLRKHKAIRTSLGVSVPVPGNSNDVMEAVLEGLLLRESSAPLDVEQMAFFNDLGLDTKHKRDRLFEDWESASEREKRSRTLFAQESIKAGDVALELDAVRASIGGALDVEAFIREAVLAHHGTVVDVGPIGKKALAIDLTESPRALRDAMGITEPTLVARFERPVGEKEVHLTRTHPVVDGLATYILDAALDQEAPGIARRSGVIRTAGVTTRTTLLIVRARYHIHVKRSGVEHPLLAEDLLLLAFSGAPESASWIEAGAAASLLELTPNGNVPVEQARNFVRTVVSGYDVLAPHVIATVESHGLEILEAHTRVRKAAKLTSVSHRVEPQFPADVLGLYIFLPNV